MAIIYSYPEGVIEPTDFLLGTKINESGHPTKSFLVSDLITLAQPDLSGLVPYTGATGNVNLGPHSVYTSGGAMLYDDGTVEGVAFQFNNGFVSYLNSNASITRSWYMPDASGVVALVDDLDALDLQQVMANGGNSTYQMEIIVAAGPAITGGTTEIGENGIIGSGGQYGAGVYGTNSLSGTGVSGYAPLGTGVSGNGQVGVTGTTSTGTAIYGNASTSGVGVLAGSVSGIAISVIQGGVSIGGGTGSVGYQLKLSSDSAAKPSTNTWTIASDSRIKENINPYTKGLETIMAINPITYDYNGLAGFEPTKGNIGIIAQDLISVLPESIKTYHTLLNENDEEQTELYTFDSHALTFVLINAIKELKAEIEILKAK